jgi:hypothetical protein
VISTVVCFSMSTSCKIGLLVNKSRKTALIVEFIFQLDKDIKLLFRISLSKKYEKQIFHKNLVLYVWYILNV